MKIGIKLVMAFLLVAVLVLIVGLVSTAQGQKELQKSIGENSVLLAQETLNKIDRIIYYRIEQLQAYSKDLSKEEGLTKSNQEFEKLDNIQEYIDGKDQEWISAPKETITPFMQELINNELSKELKEFYEGKYNHVIFAEIFVTNKYGVNAAQTGKTSDYYQADEEWWQKTKEDGLYIADIEYDESAGVYSTDISIRIDDENGSFLGVMKVVLNNEESINIIRELEEEEEAAETLSFILIKKDGKRIYSSGDFEMFSELSAELLSLLSKEDDYFIAEGDEHGEGEELFAHAHSKGYKDFKGLGWILVIEQETEEIFAPTTKLKTIILTISVIVIILAILIGFFISKSISKPIKKLTKDVDEITKGNFKIKLEKSNIFEIQKLTDSLNRILASLKLAVLRTGAEKEDIGIGKKEAVEAKKKAEKKYKILYETSKDAIMTLAPPSWKFTSGNPATVEMFDTKTEKKFISLGPWEVSPKYQPDGQLSSVKAKKMIMKAMKEGSNFFEWTHNRYKGKNFPATVLLTRLELEKGKPFLQATVRDISKEDKAEQQLKESEEKYKTLFENASEAIFVADTSTRKIIDCNKAAEKLIKYPKKKILSMTADQLHPKDIIKQTMDGFKKQAQGKIKTVESEVITKNRKRIPVSISTAPIKIEDKNYMFGIFRVK